MKTITVRLIKSPIGYAPDQRQTVRGLGLSRVNQRRELPDTPAVRGMIFKVRHLVEAGPAAAAEQD